MDKLTARAQKAEKEASEAKAESIKARDQIVILHRDFKTMKAGVRCSKIQEGQALTLEPT
jgi:hypothetical protein